MARKNGSGSPGGGIPSATTLEVLAQRIRALRTERAITQEEFAARAGISISFVSMLERGERSPSYETLLQLAEGLDVPPAELFRDADQAGYDDPYYRVLVDFARSSRLSRTQVDRVIGLARALFDLPESSGPPPRESARRRDGRVCSVPSCGKPLLARGLCSAHYHAERRRRAQA